MNRPDSSGGLIAIGGPPLGGKAVLAAELVEWIPRAIKLEVTDDLRVGGVDAGTGGPLLSRSREIYRTCAAGRRPTIVLVARFASPGRRRRAQTLARDLGACFLFVEARSSNELVREQVLTRIATAAEARQRVARYRSALKIYRPVNRAEEIILPALRLRSVRSDLSAAVARTLATWTEILNRRATEEVCR